MKYYLLSYTHTHAEYLRDFLIFVDYNKKEEYFYLHKLVKKNYN